MKNRIVELKKRLQPENAAVLARFAADGVDISSEKEVAFFIEMPSKDDLFRCSSVSGVPITPWRRHSKESDRRFGFVCGR